MKIPLDCSTTQRLGPHMLTVPGLAGIPSAGSCLAGIEEHHLGGAALVGIGVLHVGSQAIVANGIVLLLYKSSQSHTEAVTRFRRQTSISVVAGVVGLCLGRQRSTYSATLTAVVGVGCTAHNGKT